MKDNKQRHLSPDGDRLMTLNELANQLRIHRTTLYRLVRDAEVPFIRIGGQYRFHLATVMQALEENADG